MAPSQLELERAARIAANQARLAEIGLLQTVQTITTAQTAAAAERRAKARASKAARRAAHATVGGERRVRRSERVAGIDAPNYNENSLLLALADGTGAGGGRDRRLIRENVSEEVYGVEHLDSLGSYQQEWELFVDGYNANGERIYDKVNGQTCHQCRQKTLGKRTSCSSCHSLTGVLCGDCLFMRYGENVDEVNANPEWVCPHCRDLCNCSFHRSKRGWAPTGTLYRHASAEGYKSCAHFLVLNNLSEEAKPVALERGMCPPELAAELKKEIEAAKKDKAEKGKQAAEEAPMPASGAEQPAAAVVAQLAELDGEEEGQAAAKPAAAPARRSGRGCAKAASDGKQQQQQAAPKAAAAQEPAKKRMQGTIPALQQAAAGKKAKGGPAAAGPARRGLRSSARIGA